MMLFHVLHTQVVQILTQSDLDYIASSLAPQSGTDIDPNYLNYIASSLAPPSGADIDP